MSQLLRQNPGMSYDQLRRPGRNPTPERVASHGDGWAELPWDSYSDYHDADAQHYGRDGAVPIHGRRDYPYLWDRNIQDLRYSDYSSGSSLDSSEASSYSSDSESLGAESDEEY